MHASMVSPSFSQTVCAEVATQAHLLTNGCDNFPGLTAPDWLHKTVNFGIKKDEMGMIIR
jgi:hypothetical protein